MLFPIPIVCFLGALITDVAYSRSARPMWLNFSQWLLAAGLLGALRYNTLNPILVPLAARRA